MAGKKLVWNKVTKFSQLVAVLLGLLIFILGLYLGSAYQALKDTQTTFIP